MLWSWNHLTLVLSRNWQKRTKECREKKSGEGRTLFEKQILGRDKRQNVISSKKKVIEVEWKGMDCKPSTFKKRLQGLCEGGKGREVQKTVLETGSWRGREKEIEGWFQVREQVKYNCVVRIVSLSHWIWSSAKLKGEEDQRPSSGEQWQEDCGLFLFSSPIMKLKKVERLCREVWRSCQQVWWYDLMPVTNEKGLKGGEINASICGSLCNL